MLTAADEWHVHQTPEPIAVAGTDRNFHDRSWFSGFTPDHRTMFAVAFGIYPHLNVADAHVSVIRDGRQVCLHASKTLHSDRATLAVGPVSIEIVEPLQRLRVRVAEQDGIAADFEVVGRHFPVEEPRFIHRVGPRTFMDYTRLSQSARISGWVSVDGERIDLDGALGVRDRSWGIRNAGLSDPQPYQPPVEPQFFWVWTPVHFADRTVFWHVNDDAEGRPWNTRGTICPDGADAAGLGHADGRLTFNLQPGTRWLADARIDMSPREGAPFSLSYEPLMYLEMQGLGYFHPEWAHGTPHGELRIGREDLVLADARPDEPQRLHRQVLCRVTARHEDGGEETGIGIMEHLVHGPYAPLGLT